MDRKLASVQRVVALDPIENADAIERATVLGWHVVVKKEDFEPGHLGVFFEIDSVLPEGMPWAEFMRPRNFRVKTCKLRGQLSQGLFMPLDILPPEAFDGPPGNSYIEEGKDVTEFLGVTKYEPPLPRGHDIIGGWPGDVPKTDEIRLQSAPGILEEIKTRPFYVTVKCDGMSGTFIKREDGLHVYSRNYELGESNGPHWAVAKRYNLAETIPTGYAIQGEVCGPAIQKNRLGLKEHDLFVFNVFDTKRGIFLSYDAMVMFCHRFRLKTVPYAFEVDQAELADFPFTVENFLQLAEGTYDGTTNRREGIVIRPIEEAHSDVLNGRLSFKVISNSFLLKDED